MSRLLPRTAAAALAAGAVVALGSAAGAFGAIQTPPPPGVLITVGVNESFIRAEGLPNPVLPGAVHAEVWRGGTRVGITQAATPTGGPVEFNRAAPGVCFQGVTPDLLPGDQVRIVNDTVPTDGYATTLRALTAQAPVQAGPDTVVMQGTAATAAGLPLPVIELSALIREGQFRLDAPGEGTIASSPSGSTAWTATFGALSPQVVADALNATRIELTWSRTEGGEAQIVAVGVPPGPSANCTAAARAVPPGTPDLIAADDSGASSTDDLTSNPQPVFQGTALPPSLDAGPNVELIDAISGSPVVIGGPTPVNPIDGSYSLTPASPLPDGPHEIRVRQSILGQDLPSGLLNVSIDTQTPAPVFLGSTPPSGGNANAPSLRGTAEIGSAVTIHTDPGCEGPAASGSATAFGAAGLAVIVPDDSTTTFFARAVDAAGNVSPCSGPLVYQEVTSMAVPATAAATAAALVPQALTTGMLGPRAVGPFTLVTRAARVRRSFDVRLKLACGGLPTELCVGRIELRARIPASAAGGPAHTGAIGRKSFAIRGGRQTTIVVRINRQGRDLLGHAGPNGLRVTARVTVRRGTVLSRRDGIPLILVHT